MKITIQPGIDAHAFQALMYDLAISGAKAEAAANERKYAERLRLAKQGSGTFPATAVAQGSLFGEEG